ncbi:MAG: hypothetical protein WD638_10155, partial [Nitriliruptoraceae bacterium]
MLEVLPRRLRTADEPLEVVQHLHQRLAERGLELPLRLWDGSTLGPDDASYRIVLRYPWTAR